MFVVFYLMCHLSLFLYTGKNVFEEDIAMEEVDEQVLGIGVAGHFLQKGNGVTHKEVAIDARLSLDAQHMGVAFPLIAAEQDTEEPCYMCHFHYP